MTKHVTPTPPPEVQIGHLLYEVTLDQAALDKASVELGTGGFAGRSNSAEQKITLSEDMAPDYARDTMLHEVLHQCLRASGYDPDADAEAGIKDVEERTIKAMCGPLLATLRANPDLLEYLTVAAVPRP